jgi:hypothetical protein
MRAILALAVIVALLCCATAHATMPAPCAYSGLDHQYASNCSGKQKKQAAFKAFCQDVDGARGAYIERGDCEKLLHGSARPN